MKILLVVHYYLPKHQAGTEIYTHILSRELKKRHEVTILTSEDADFEPGRYEVAKDEYDGTKVIRILRGQPPDFVSSYKDEKLDKIFGSILDDYQPDLVHFQHLYRLSIGFINECKLRKVPRVLTLADYWFICPSIIMLKPSYVRCTGPEKGVACAVCGNAVGEEFAGAAAAEMLGAGKTRQYVLQAMHALKRTLPQPIVDFAKDIKDKAVSASSNSIPQRRLDLLTDRNEAMLEALNNINLILAPSRFLRETYVYAGVPPYKISYSDYGFEVEKFPRRARKPFKSPLKIGYVGTIVPHKGVHILMDAFRRVNGATLEIHGDLNHFPNYVKSLQKLAKGKPVQFMGSFDNEKAGEIMSRFDLMVVPSLWWENSPLTIHEAFLVGVPVLASRAGGMGELVADPMFLFEPGDVNELAKILQDFVNHPETLRALGDRRGEVKSIAENVDELENIYEIVSQKVQQEES